MTSATESEVVDKYVELGRRYVDTLTLIDFRNAVGKFVATMRGLFTDDITDANDKMKEAATALDDMTISVANAMTVNDTMRAIESSYNEFLATLKAARETMSDAQKMELNTIMSGVYSTLTSQVSTYMYGSAFRSTLAFHDDVKGDEMIQAITYKVDDYANNELYTALNAYQMRVSEAYYNFPSY